ncbi:glycosyltransferase family 4 protein [Chloroflexota bacterium]
MNICIVGKSLNKISGHSKPAFDLARELAAHGHNVTILTSQSALGLEDIKKQFAAYQNIKVITPCRSLMLGILLGNKSLITTINNFDIIHLFDSIPPKLIRSHLTNPTPIIYTLNGPYRIRISELVNAGGLSLLNIFKPAFFLSLFTPKLVYQKVLSSFDQIISTSNYMTRDALALGVAEQKIKTIPMWIDTESFDDIPVRKDTSSPNLVYFGWGSAIRGVPDVISAFKQVLHKYPEAKLRLCFTGFHGIEENLYEHIIRKSKIKHCTISKGYDPNIFSIIRAADIVILPFRAACGYAQPPLVVLEAMALGKVVISTYTGSIAEIISDGETGILVQPRDARALAKKIIDVLSSERTKQKIENQAKGHILDNHGLKDAAKKITQIYANVIDKFDKMT